MASLSGIVKRINDLVTGTPADDDCFVFGKSDLKKITLAKLKDALGITSIKSAVGNLKFKKQGFSNVSNSYSDDNRLRFNGDVIGAETYPSSAWLIVLNGTSVTASGAIYLALAGTDAPNMAILELAKSGSIYPTLKATGSSGLLYVAWSAKRNAYITASMFKLS